MTDTSGIEADLWHVEVTPGNVLVVTLDQLDDAFNQGLVNEQTRVWQDGMACAVPLHELLGLDSEGSEPDVPAPQHRHAIPPAPVLVPQSYPPPAAYRPAAIAPQSRAPVASHASAWPPVVARPSSAPPPASTPTAWQANAAPSVIPTAFDISDDFVPFARPKRRGAMLFAVMSVLAIGGGAAVFAHNNGLTLTLTPSTAAAVAPPAPVVEPPRSHAYDPGSEPIHLKEMPAPLEITKADTPAAVAAKVSPAEAASLREAALKAANSKSPKTSHTHAKAATARNVQNRAKTGATSFKGTKSGSKYDPLNGAL
jgi:hypothetical protein